MSAIENHGVVGNLLTCALISIEDARVDWMCFPHFDSPPIFSALVDAPHGGFFRITAGSELQLHDKGSHTPRDDKQQPHAHKCRMATKQMYFHETNCLLTRFFTDSGVGHVTGERMWPQASREKRSS